MTVALPLGEASNHISKGLKFYYVQNKYCQTLKPMDIPNDFTDAHNVFDLK
jgi:hypothetical protein